MGVHHRLLNIGKQLKKCGQITVVYVGKAVSPDSIIATKRWFDNIIVMETDEYKGPKLWVKFKTKFDFHWPWHYAKKVSANDRRLFEKLYREHDIVWFHTLPTADSFGIQRPKKSVIDIDDSNYLKHLARAELSIGLRQKIADRFLLFKWKLREQKLLQRFDFMAVCSDSDKHHFGDDSRIVVIPNGFNRPDQKPGRNFADNMRLGFIGNLRYGPNMDGLQWFGDNIWPVIRKQLPHAQLRIVGKIPVNAEFLNVPGFETLGFIEDTAEEFGTWSAMIVPLRYGGGTRLKILEAFSRMCSVVSTTAGAYGIKTTNGTNIILQDDEEGFAQSCIKLLKDRENADAIAEGGWKLFVNNYTWDIIGEEIKRTVGKCVDLDIIENGSVNESNGN
jgi:glycosyltransferase involved in cell wall biosynthesis